MTREADPLLRRFHTGAVVWCIVALVVAVIGWPGRWDVAAGVLGGGVLAAVSVLAITSSIDALLPAVPPAQAADAETGERGRTTDPGRSRVAARAVLKLAGRYGLLALLAYVMIARLRLHPVGLVAGASSLVASASFEAVRWMSGSRPIPPHTH